MLMGMRSFWLFEVKQERIAHSLLGQSINNYSRVSGTGYHFFSTELSVMRKI